MDVINDRLKIKQVQNAINEILDTMTNNATFSGAEFCQMVKLRVPSVNKWYDETILRLLRKFGKGRYKCTNPSKSLYIKWGELCQK